MTAPLAYLATPFSHYVHGIEQAFIDASRLSARLLQAGVLIYSPIVAMHPMALYGNLDPYDLEFWLAIDQAMMSRCDTLIVAHLQSWGQSEGIKREIEFFEQANKPIYDLDPFTLTMTRRPDKRLRVAALR